MQHEKLKIILIHGNGGATMDNHWFPYIKDEMTKLNIPVIARNFPDPELARMKFWLPFLKNELEADEYSVLIGHSSGALAALRYAEENKILGSVLVGVMHTDIGDEQEKLSGYFDAPWNWEAIRENQQWIIQYASTDDPWIPIEEPRYIHDQLKSEYHEFTEWGHFMTPTIPDLVNILKEKLM